MSNINCGACEFPDIYECHDTRCSKRPMMKNKSEQGTLVDLGKPPSIGLALVTFDKKKKKKKKDNKDLLKSIKKLLGYVTTNP